MMKLQVAIDRVTLEEFQKSVLKLDGIVDVVEVGTSLIKDYGMDALKSTASRIKQSEVLFDLKTIDEGTYEFEKGFAAGADTLTVMASSSIDTIEQVYALTVNQEKKMLIDLLAVNDEKIAELRQFDKAIFGLHYSHDNKNQDFDAVKAVEQFHNNFPNIKNIAVAGGIDIEQASKLAKQGIVERIIVGGKIMNNETPVEMAEKFMEVIR